MITPLSIRREAGGEASGGCEYCKENSKHERRKALVSLKRTPLSLVEEALLAHRRGPSGRQLGLFFLAIRNSLISLWI